MRFWSTRDKVPYLPENTRTRIGREREFDARGVPDPTFQTRSRGFSPLNKARVDMICGHASIENEGRPGRVMRYRSLPDLPIPEALALPTCGECGEWFLNRESAPLVDAVMGAIYMTELRRRIAGALETLEGRGVRRRDLEPLLGLPAGSLKDLEPSATLLAVLTLLVADPKNLDVLHESFHLG